MIAYGKLPKDAMATGFCEGKLGFEFSGLAPAPADAPARRVMGIAKQAIATRVNAPPYLVRAPDWLHQLLPDACHSMSSCHAFKPHALHISVWWPRAAHLLPMSVHSRSTMLHAP